MKVVQDHKRARDLTAADRAEIIRQLDFGSSLKDTLVQELANSSVVLDFRRRRFVYRAGEPADCLYAIIRGRVKLCRIENDSGREAVIDILPEGSLLGSRPFILLRGSARIPQSPTKTPGSYAFTLQISNGGWLRRTYFMITLSV